MGLPTPSDFDSFIDCFLARVASFKLALSYLLASDKRSTHVIYHTIPLVSNTDHRSPLPSLKISILTPSMSKHSDDKFGDDLEVSPIQQTILAVEGSNREFTLDSTAATHR
jgi:hypothetical protein